ncbi:UNVERIFIED_CONTAM: hypothetical protein Scaly_0862700 [Sesamum calycinum]|uniref:Uncharacterized protein n=1 Tax=Sesamum calycinum TaxID=2727403 RepID=A0AAW2QVL8_9LAMI
MDFITHLPSSNGKTVIWVVVDRLSKYAHFVSLPTHFTATSLAASFSEAIYKLHVEYWYNSMHHSPIGMPPFQALYGRAPPAIVDYVEDAFPIAIVDEFLRHRKDVLAAAKYHLAHTRHLMKLQANQHRRDCALNVGIGSSSAYSLTIRSRCNFALSISLADVFLGLSASFIGLASWLMNLNCPPALKSTRYFTLCFSNHFASEFPKFDLEDKIYLDGAGNDTGLDQKSYEQQSNYAHEPTKNLEQSKLLKPIRRGGLVVIDVAWEYVAETGRKETSGRDGVVVCSGFRLGSRPTVEGPVMVEGAEMECCWLKENRGRLVTHIVHSHHEGCDGIVEGVAIVSYHGGGRD